MLFGYLTLGPIGYMRASGSWATLVTLPLVWFLSWLQVSLVSYLVVIGILTSLAFYGLLRARGTSATTDPSEIVIDEVIGCLITFVGVPITWNYIIAGFALFRLFDITKIGGIARVERLPHAWGILLDDCIAGLFACCLLHVISYCEWL